MSGIDYSEKIPNNVNLANDRTLQRALEHWQPRFLEWWREMGPNDFASVDVYLRTAVGVDAQGWAHYGTVKMPDYRWGVFLADPIADRSIGFDPRWDRRGRRPSGSHRGSQHRLRGLLRPAGVAAGARRIPLAVPPPHRHPGRHRARFGRTTAPARPHLPFSLRS